MADINIENIVASLQIADSLDLTQLAIALPNTQFDREESPTLFVHMQDPPTAVMLFATGKAIITGPKSMGTVNTIVKKLYDSLTAAGVTAYKDPAISVQTMIASVDLHRTFDLVAVAQSPTMENVTYAPDQFPGLIYHMEDPHVCVLLFESGKMICTGVQVEDVSTAIEQMMTTLASIGK